MAKLSQPIWTPNPCTALPNQMKVTFLVAPNGSSVQIRYTLQSPELQFVTAAAPADATASQPAPASSTPGSEIVDVVKGLAGPTQIVRLLTIDQSGPTKPGMPRLKVCVADFDQGFADETSCLGVMIAFNVI
jgi:hypothetical protein